MSKKFVKWLVCDQEDNRCPTLEELKKTLDKYYDGNPDAYEFEISLVKEDNKFGQQSYGWDGDDKIILFDSLREEFETVEELHKKLDSYYKRAIKKCANMNKNLEEALY